ncbi:hypothetical protein FA15DRAFT_745114 [Coprinopsis marcescibilis]|uniref:F-box domain-containing protein n=1 Tax=Coprinopsis marcescibilis TaxID=230819 RepID=A0A5C3KTA7_COPMA|nr:hypothetical protein FA15DRAFT_745114 [Coprinopsis marcescibilis]
MDTLPQELVEKVVDHIPKHSIAAASLTCSLFREPCQRRLLSTILVQGGLCSRTHPNNPSRPGKRLWRLFQLSPTAASYVRAVQINDDTCCDGCQWLDEDEDLLKALQLIAQQNLIQFLGIRMRNHSHIDIGPNAKASLLAICRCDSFTQLQLEKAPVNIIDWAGPSLKEVQLISPTYAEDPSFQVTPVGPPTKLSYLRVLDICMDYPEQILSHLVNGTRAGTLVGGLKELVLDAECADPENTKEFPRLLAECMDVVEIFSFDCPEFMPDYSEGGPEHLKAHGLPDFSFFVRLKALNLSFRNSSLSPSDPVLWALHRLMTFSSYHPRLESVGLFLRQSISPDGITHSPNPEYWRKIDEILFDRQKFPNLKKVKVEFAWEMSRRGPTDDRDQIEPYLTRLQTEGILIISSTYYWPSYRRLLWWYDVMHDFPAAAY